MSFWDKPKQIARLRELVNEGLTAKQIGDVLSCSRGAVIGKCARLRIVLKSKWMLPAPKPTVVPPAPKPTVVPAKPLPVKKSIPARERAHYGVIRAVMNIRQDECRYPVGQLSAPDFHFCSEPIDPANTTLYCTEHHKACHSASFRVPR